MTQCKTKFTPCTIDPLGTDADGSPFSESWNYASVVGMLMYLCSNAYPEIQYAVHQCARFTHCPKKSHAEGIKKICRYLKGVLLLDEKHKKRHGLKFKKNNDFSLDCYVDANFAGLWNHENDQDPVCVKSRSGYVMMLNGCPVHWVSKLQTEIALSTLESEYIALSTAMRELLPMRNFVLEIQDKMKLGEKKNVTLKSTVFEDNNGALSLASSPKMTPRTKHIAVKYHFFRDKIGEDKGIVLEKIDTTVQIADIFTKGFAIDKFQHLRNLLCGW